jgi:hypothetical protein
MEHGSATLELGQASLRISPITKTPGLEVRDHGGRYRGTTPTKDLAATEQLGQKLSHVGLICGNFGERIEF